MSARRVFAPLLAVLCDLGFLAAVAAAYKGMRSVMTSSGGFCASGGPYAIAPGHHCSGSEVDYVMFGIIGGLLFAAAAVAAASWARWSAFGTAMTFWAVAFGALGWNFMSLGFDPPHGQNGGTGWIVCGVVFWAMALGGVVPVITTVVAWIRRGRGPEPIPSFTAEPLVRAVVPHD
jgi:hypothetical protein